jgi:ABC-type lipoprotein export system ATPase subunit
VKIYNKNKKTSFKALDGVTLTFPKCGMVFVTGKSGCGKTTLLNLIGMLDAPDGGSVEIDGKSVFSSSDADAYRNGYVGMIFQDLNLLSDFDVIKNISLAREINRQTLSDAEGEELLKSVSLDGLAHRKISELSGGQKQRVAIARILAKNPKIILADEPTGNLDKKNGTIVFDILKKLSETRLVIVVTHDIECAQRYADRIIRMSDGKVVEDVVKNEDYRREILLKNDGSIELYADAEISDSLAAFLGTRGEKDVVLSDKSRFSPVSDEPPPAENSASYRPSAKTRLPFFTLLTLSFSKILRQKFKFIISILITVISLTVFGVSSVFAEYDIGKVSAENFMRDDETSIMIRKGEEFPPFGYVDRSYGRAVTSADKSAILNGGYVDSLDEYYVSTRPYLTFNRITTGSEWQTTQIRGYFETTYARLVSDYGYTVPYGWGAFPTQNTRGNEGYLAVAITDYTAYIIEQFGAETTSGENLYGKSPEYLVEKTVDFNGDCFRIAAVIKTDFEKFKDALTKKESELDDETAESLYYNLFNADYYTSFYTAVGTHESFFIDTIPDASVKIYTAARLSKIKEKLGNVTVKGKDAESLLNGEILMSDAMFKATYQEEFSAEKVGSYAPFVYKSYSTAYNGSLDFGTYKVVGVYSGVTRDYTLTAYSVVIADGDFAAVAKQNIRVTGFHVRLPISRAEQAAFVKFLDGMTFFHETKMSYVTYQVYNNLSVYKTVFLYLSFVLAIVCALFLLNFMLSSIKDRRHEIGVLRAMGVRGADISGMFLLQAILIFVIGAALCSACIAGLTYLLNGILYQNFYIMLADVNTLLKYVSLLTLNEKPFLYTFALMAGILLFSVLFSAYKLVKMKPIECIKE